MKSRHAAALALVGWYLMVPPTMGETRWICGKDSSIAALARQWLDWGEGCSTYNQVAAPGAPLSQWHRVNRFDTVAECERGRLQLSRGKWAQCIASDDPRLKGD
jgi:hypothetical protein